MSEPDENGPKTPDPVFQDFGMKHPNPNIESFVYNLGRATVLRCTDSDKKVCGKCDGCQFQSKITPVKEWLQRAGDQTKRRFMIGLMRRLHSVDLVKYVVNLLQPLLCKDFMYAHSRSKPGLETDAPTMSNDRALNVVELEQNIAETWNWFQSSSYWIKSNFLLIVLQQCEQHLLHLIGTHARTLLTSEEAAFTPFDEYETESIPETVHSYESDRSELELLTTVCPTYTTVKNDPFKEDTFEETEHTDSAMKQWESYNDEIEIINDDSGDQLFGEDSMFGTVDPTCMVAPGSAKAYSGVSLYKDFIRCLPVHLSKYILGMLDQVSLFNCVCVSKIWRNVAEEVHKEYYINQHLQEEVMLMQGASAQGCNPFYAKDIDVAVPNIEVGTWQAIRTEEEQIETTYKSEVSFETAYSGFQTRKIIMEERNVYCGAYNVMVLIDQPDGQRVVHTDGGRLISLGSADRKVRLVDTETCRQVEPVINGHAGSIRCVALCEEKGFVISGSYDTSVRMWSLKTGKCQKIFRGHRDTVVCLQVCGNLLVSGAKDNMCKVWNMDTKKCTRTFKHRHAITAVAMSDEVVISGCEAGRVKVWHLASGKLIKMLTGHHDVVTAIRFDRWHITTASKDGYALVWSSQGNHNRCLTALRHPKEVLAVEQQYLRVISGSADGKLRIWNLVTGQCLRIMRGNSRSDPILALIAIGNRVTVNTSRNLLLLNFEPVDYDYTLTTDKMPPLVQYSKFSDAPVRKQPYAYIRAQRMQLAGAANPKIVYHDGAQPPAELCERKARSEQIAHSAKSLGRKSLLSAKRIQSAQSRDELMTIKSSLGEGVTASASMGALSRKDDESSERYPRDFDVKSMIAHSIRSVSLRGKPPTGAHSRVAKSRAAFSTTRSGTQSVVSVSGFRIGGRGGDDDSSVLSEEEEVHRRRVSWAFEKPVLPQASHIGLAETKSLLRSQIRAQGDVVPPDFVYLTVNSIHASMKPTEASKNMELNRRQAELAQMKRLGRPNSSPSRVDPRTKVPREELDWEAFCIEQGIAPKESDGKSLAESKISFSTRNSLRSKRTQVDEPPVNELPTTQIITEFAPVPVESKPAMSLYDKNVKTSIPKARLIRPHTAKVIYGAKPLASSTSKQKGRPKSAVEAVRPGSRISRGSTVIGAAGAAGPTPHSRPMSRVGGSAGVRPVSAVTHLSQVTSAGAASSEMRIQKKPAGYTSSSKEASFVPMLMYSGDIQARKEEWRQARIERQTNAVMSALAAPAPESQSTTGSGVSLRGSSSNVSVGHTSSVGRGGGGGPPPRAGCVSPFNGPMRNHVDFKLLTHEQTTKQMSDMKIGLSDSGGYKDDANIKQQKAAWLLKVKGQLDKEYMKKGKAFAPEIHETKNPLTVV